MLRLNVESNTHVNHSQDLLIPPQSAVYRVDWLHNFSFDDASGWKYVVTRILPPACLPEELSTMAWSAIEVLTYDTLLRGGIRSGISLSVPRLNQVCASIQCPVPAKGQGSGKAGRVKKVDLVKSLITFLWQNDSKESQKEMVRGMMGWNKTEPVDLSVLSMVSELDTENQESFERLKRDALKTFEKNVFGRGRAEGVREAKREAKLSGRDPNAAGEDFLKSAETTAKKLLEKKDAANKEQRLRQWNLTPPELRQLLPGNGEIVGVFSMRWHPHQRWWRVTFPTGALTRG